MTGYVITFLLGFFLGAFTASKTFRTKVINEGKKFSNWWKRYAEGENKKSKKKGAK